MKYLLTLICAAHFVFIMKAQQIPASVDPIQYPKGYPNPSLTVIDQLMSYPTPRYMPGNKLHVLFNWMDPNYMGGKGQKGLNPKTISNNAIAIQKELITNWNYGIVISNAATAFNGPASGTCTPLTKLANDNPNVPLHVITFWTQVRPRLIGYNKYPTATITNKKLDSSLYITFDFYGKMKREINFNFPDSLIKIDGHTQKNNLSKIISCLTRPIDMINENGEEPPGPYLIDAIQKDKLTIRMKDSMQINSWKEFMATRKLQMRNNYSSSFMKEIPELQQTHFNFYAVEGGPVNCFDWPIMKTSMTPIDGKYYSTPDFYPRWPSNWKDWQGPWHGWKWIEEGRQVEIKNGDHLFSPFVAAGWSKNQEEDIRPGQWLGLLKCLSVIGAEFYYVGYFSLGAPYTDPAKWTWQAVMPAYAQAATSRFEDVLKNGNVLFNDKREPIITYKTNDKHVLITIRKHDQKEKYVICGTYQPFSNEKNEISEKKDVTLSIAGEELSFEIRRQGSMYVYEKTPEGKILFYQLDSWHENAHPDHWTKDFYFEAEVSDSIILNTSLTTLTKKDIHDFTDFTTYVSMDKNMSCCYHYNQRDTLSQTNYLWIKYKGVGTIMISAHTNKNQYQEEKIPTSEDWKWYKIKLSTDHQTIGNKDIQLQLKKGNIDLDKLVITTKDALPKE